MAKKTKTRKKAAAVELVELGRRVREVRLSRGFTQEELAEQLDLSVAYVSLIERGGRNPPYLTVLAIADALQARAGELVS